MFGSARLDICSKGWHDKHQKLSRKCVSYLPRMTRMTSAPTAMHMERWGWLQGRRSNGLVRVLEGMQEVPDAARRDSTQKPDTSVTDDKSKGIFLCQHVGYALMVN